jgi:uncharacterized membrane protein
MGNHGGSKRSVVFASAVIGFGLSGFFDGILLHQVLQWHHLLSLVPGAVFRDLGTQILADGLFHVFMYLVTAAGLWLLWRARAALSDEGVGWRAVAGGGLTGFGVWNFIDVGLFHWTLGIHRIRINAPDPMLYDVSWLIALGAIPFAIGWLLLRSDKARPTGGGRNAGAILSVFALLAAPLAALPPRGTSTALVLFAPGSSPADAVNAAVAARAPILWADPAGRMLAVSVADGGASKRLYQAGALLVTRSPAAAGCAASLT